MNAKHTPGPWHASTRHAGEIDGPDGERVATVQSMRPGAEQHANGRLLAAAPDLLAALEAVEGLLDAFPGFDSRAVPFTDKPTGNIGQIVREAIARATGVEP